MADLIIPDSVYPYLLVQKGEINHIKDRAEFEAAYNEGLRQRLENMKIWLPIPIINSLDIGSGMGGIDILLQKEYKQEVTLLDGGCDKPICLKHDIPFNSIQPVWDFFKTNNCDQPSYILPTDSNVNNPQINIKKYDLIFSVGSYCFHYSPDTYLDFVKASCHKDTVLIFDVRNRHDDWLETLRNNFDEIACIEVQEKFSTRVFTVK